jgi:hypothetical protein
MKNKNLEIKTQNKLKTKNLKTQNKLKCRSQKKHKIEIKNRY